MSAQPKVKNGHSIDIAHMHFGVCQQMIIESGSASVAKSQQTHNALAFSKATPKCTVIFCVGDSGRTVDGWAALKVKTIFRLLYRTTWLI